ncbi:hypothetical protein VTO42DRAFT_5033 [Malbranchea cinnamomea]
MDLEIAKPFTLRCGLRLPNRLIKAAMTEQMTDSRYLPGEVFHRVYREWARGGWGMLITGNVQVDNTFLGAMRDIAVDPAIEAELSEAWKKWAEACNVSDTPVIMQINHPGRQSPLGAGKKGLFTKAIAPSAVPLKFGDGYIARFSSALLFGTPAEMTLDDIQKTIKQFAYTASMAAQTGFAGVQLHAAHGYLLAQFLSEDTNKRTDAYGGTPENRVRIILEIIKAVREVVPQTFCISIKFNSVDHQSPSKLRDCIRQLKLIAEAGVDFLEISGGTYEDPTMAAHSSEVDDSQPKSASTAAREAFFLEFSKAIRKEIPDVPLMVTGGFRTRRGMEAAVSENACDFIGIGRPAVLDPLLPKTTIFNPEIPTEKARLYARKIETPWLSSLLGLKQIGSGAQTAWYSAQIPRIGL